MSMIRYTCMGDLQLSGDGGKTWQTVGKAKIAKFDVRKDVSNRKSPVKAFDTTAEADSFHAQVAEFLNQHPDQ